MKKPDVLNRSMFNRGGTSAYGRGITSNLVSDEQRQRFNYGGRVGYQNRGYVNTYLGDQDWYNYDKKPWETVDNVIPSKSNVSLPVSSETDDDIPNEWEGLVEGVEVEDIMPGPYLPGHFRKQKEKKEASEQAAREEMMHPREPGIPKVEEEIIKAPPELKTDPKSDVIDWETFAEGLYDKKGAKGKAQLELAGNVLAAAFQPKKEAMAILGKGLGDFGKTASARKEKMEDIAATGKMYDKIYTTRATEKGRQDRLTQLNKIKTGNPWTDYQAALLSLKDKDDAIDFATGETVRTLTVDTKTKEVDLPSDGIPGQLFKNPITQQYFLIDKDGKPQPINIQKYLKNFKLD